MTVYCLIDEGGRFYADSPLTTDEPYTSSSITSAYMTEHKMDADFIASRHPGFQVKEYSVEQV